MAKNNKKQKKEYGLLIVGRMRLFMRERTVKKGSKKYTFTDYSISISRKNEKGEYTNLYMPVFFAKDLDKPEDSCMIVIKDSTLFITGNEGYEKISLYVKDYEIDYEE